MSEETWRDRMCSRTAGCYTIRSPEEEATPALTIRDVASFAPVPRGSRTQPSGWGVVGLPVNFLADPGAVETAGSVLGLPVRVRFTPVSFRWDYGDGERRSASEAGGPWVADFAETATSHSYAASGMYSAALTVEYNAEYSTGGGWIPLQGTVPRSAAPLPLLITSARTALTNGPCRPSDAGC